MSPSKLSPELSRNVRGLQVWLPLKMLGIKPFIDALEEKLKLVDWLASELKKIENIHIAFEPQTAIVGFKLALPGKTPAELNAINRAMLERINAHKKILLSPLELEGDFVIRIVPFGQRTHFAEVALVIDYIKEAAEFYRI
jgi:aromatic-L-amino-acid decarboxylase